MAYCVVTNNGIFELTPVETQEPGPERPIPRSVVMSFGLQNRLFAIYRTFFERQERFARAASLDKLTARERTTQLLQDVAWARTESEQAALRKSAMVVAGYRSVLAKIGVTQDELKNPNVLELSPVKAYLEAEKTHCQLESEINTRAMERLNSTDLTYTYLRFAMEIFSELTCVRDIDGVEQARYSVDQMMNSLYWSHQGDLLFDTMKAVIDHVTVEFKLMVKKTQELVEFVFLLQQAVSEGFELPDNTSESPGLSTNVLPSSLSLIQDEFNNLKKRIPESNSNTSST